MWNGSVVIDAVAHGYDLRLVNRGPAATPAQFEGFTRGLVHQALHSSLESRQPGYLMSYEEFSYGWTAEDLAQVYFEESDTDLIVYHEVQINAVFRNGASPWEVGAELKRVWPDRVLLYAFVDPLAGPGQLERMHERAETGLVDGWKFYPADGTADPLTGLPRAIAYDDRELAFPFFEKAQELGVTKIAIHKGIPVGPGLTDKENPREISVAAVTFPDLTFEVVHEGWAFMEEACYQLMMHPNIYANLEAVANFGVRRPRRLAEILAQFLQAGAEDRILFAVGTPVTHPQPVIEALANLEMPQDLIDGYDYPVLTPEIKEKIFGLNFAALHGIDVETRLAAIAGDEWTARRAAQKASDHATPWRDHRARMSREGASKVGSRAG